MIAGRIERNQAIFPITLWFASGAEVTIDFVVDTGFGGFLTLPPATVASLQLPYDQDTTANLADDSEVIVAAHHANVIWEGALRSVRVLATGSRPLLGTSLLANNEFVAQFVPNGLVTLEPV